MNQRDNKLADFDDKFKKIENLFDVQVVKRHLRFLKAFRRVAQAIDENFVLKDPNTGIKSPTPRLRVYLSKAVYRYYIWITKCLRDRPEHGPLADNELPPLDVLFILHAHMIAPSRFYEDAILHFPELAQIGGFPLNDVVSRINAETGYYEHSAEQAEAWERLTGVSFDPLNMPDSLDVTCPKCNQLESVSWVESEPAKSDGKGYGELEFVAECHHCGFSITHDALSTQKFAKDLEKNVLATTISVANGSTDYDIDKSIARAIAKVLGDPRGNWGEHLSWSMKTVAKQLETATDCGISEARIADILRAYNQPSQFSTDLVYKSLLQVDFGTRLGLGGFLDQKIAARPELILLDSLRLYQSFLKLALIPNIPRLFPSPPVDLVWHTHQLRGVGYNSHTYDLVGSYVDHISMEQIAPTEAQFEDARTAWMAFLKADGVELHYYCLVENLCPDDRPCTASGSQLF